MSMILKSIEDPRKAFKYILNHIFKTVGRRDYRRFIVLSRSRTGSNLLLSFLNSHPHIFCRSEIFSRLNNRDYLKVLNQVFSKQPFYVRAAGFKLFYYHPVDKPDSDLWEHLIDMPDLYVIHLKRRNLLRTIVSRKIAQNNNTWYQTSSPGEGGKKAISTVRLSVPELNYQFNETANWETKGDQQFCHHAMLTLYYEDLAEQREKEFRRITDFFGVDFHFPNTPYKKQNPHRISELIENYDELKFEFKNTTWEIYFSD